MMMRMKTTTTTILSLCLLLSLVVVPARVQGQGQQQQQQYDEIFVGVQQNDVPLIQKSLDSGSDINVKGPGGQTPLINAVLSGKTDAAKYILEVAGADYTLTEKDGYNIAHASAFQGRSDILTMFLDSSHIKDKSIFNEPHSDGYYPIHRTCWGREQRHTDTLEVFVKKAGIDVNVKALKNGQTCYEMTRNDATKALIETLLSSNEQQQEAAADGDEDDDTDGKDKEEL